MSAATPDLESLSYASRLDAIPLASSIKKYVTGVAIFHPQSLTSTTSAQIPSAQKQSHPQPQLLIVKRAAQETLFPLQWEVPGGGVERGETIRQCLVRETFEETALVVKQVLGEFESFSWESSSDGGRGTRRSVQFNYVVTVEDVGTVKLDEREHEEFRWVTKDELADEDGGLMMTGEMRRTLYHAFAFVSGDCLS